MWRNWQTRWLQVPVLAREWRFESSHPQCQRSGGGESVSSVASSFSFPLGIAPTPFDSRTHYPHSSLGFLLDRALALGANACGTIQAERVAFREVADHPRLYARSKDGLEQALFKCSV